MSRSCLCSQWIACIWGLAVVLGGRSWAADPAPATPEVEVILNIKVAGLDEPARVAYAANVAKDASPAFALLVGSPDLVVVRQGPAPTTGPKAKYRFEITQDLAVTSTPPQHVQQPGWTNNVVIPQGGGQPVVMPPPDFWDVGWHAVVRMGGTVKCSLSKLEANGTYRNVDTWTDPFSLAADGAATNRVPGAVLRQPVVEPPAAEASTAAMAKLMDAIKQGHFNNPALSLLTRLIGCNVVKVYKDERLWASKAARRSMAATLPVQAEDVPHGMIVEVAIQNRTPWPLREIIAEVTWSTPEVVTRDFKRYIVNQARPKVSGLLLPGSKQVVVCAAVSVRQDTAPPDKAAVTNLSTAAGHDAMWLAGRLAELKTGEVPARQQAASALAAEPCPEAMEGLMAALSDADNVVRELAARSLRVVADVRAAKALVAALKDSDAQVSADALGALENIGAPAAGTVADNLKDLGPAARQQALELLGAIGDAKVVAAVMANLTDAEAGTRRSAAVALGQLKEKSTITALVGATKDAAQEVRLAAIGALGNIDDARSLAALRGLSKDADPKVAQAALAAMNRKWSN